MEKLYEILHEISNALFDGTSYYIIRRCICILQNLDDAFDHEPVFGFFQDCRYRRFSSIDRDKIYCAL